MLLLCDTISSHWNVNIAGCSYIDVGVDGTPFLYDGTYGSPLKRQTLLCKRLQLGYSAEL